MERSGLESAGEVCRNARAALLGAQDANVLAKLRRASSRSQRALQEIWMAETKAAAELAFDAFIGELRLKYEKAADWPGQGSRHVACFLRLPGRTLETPADDQSIESTSPPCANRTIRSKGAMSVERAALAMVFKLVDGAQKKLAPSRRS